MNEFSIYTTPKEGGALLRTSIQTIPESEIDAQRDQEIRDYLLELFPEWETVFRARRTWHDAKPIFTCLARTDRKIVGHIAVVVRTISTSWNWRYDVVSFQGVSVHPDRRNEGIGKFLLRTALDESIRKKYPYAILFCKEPLVPYYQKEGWRLPDDSMVMWRERILPIAMRSNCPMYRELSEQPFPEGPIDVHNPLNM